MKVGELAVQTNVSTDTLRYYEKRKLIQSVRHANGYRDFHPDMARLVHMIKLGQKMGFKLREIEEIVIALSKNDLSSDQTADILRQKITELDHKMDDMARLRELLVDALSRACPLSA